MRGDTRKLHKKEIQLLYSSSKLGFFGFFVFCFLGFLWFFFRISFDEMDEACDTHGRDRGCMQNFGWRKELRDVRLLQDQY